MRYISKIVKKLQIVCKKTPKNKQTKKTKKKNNKKKRTKNMHFKNWWGSLE